MTTTTQPKATLDSLTAASAELMQADLTVARARAKLHAMVVELYESGVRPIDIANAAGITRQRVNQIVVAAREQERLA